MGLKQKISDSSQTARWVEEYVSNARNVYRKGNCTYDGLETVYREKWISLGEVLAEMDTVVEQIRAKLLPTDRLVFADDKVTMTNRKFAEDFNQEIKEILALLNGSPEEEKETPEK